MQLKAYISGYKNVGGDPPRGHTCFIIEINNNGTRQTLEKRYSEFEELHKKLKKIIYTPPFPPKKVFNRSTKVLDERKSQLDIYLQQIITGNELLPKDLLKFLNVTANDASRSDSLDSSTNHTEGSKIRLGVFEKDPFVCAACKGDLPDIISQGVCIAIYGSVEDVTG